MERAVVSGFTVNLLTGIAVALQTASLGTWNTSGVYTTTQTGIVLGNIPQGPDRIITLTTYGVSDDPSLSDSVIGLQVRARWGGADPRLVNDLDDLIFAFLHGKTAWTVGAGATAVTIVQCLSQSVTSLGQDANGRWSISHNYYLNCWRPSTNRT
jgi:hypothetical protein